jgi:predicted CopG family antitoxin
VEISQDVYNALVNDFMKPRIDEASYSTALRLYIKKDEGDNGV